MAMMNGKRIDADIKLIVANPDVVTSKGADFAVVGLWVDDNPDNEDRLYRFVSIAGATGKEIKIADADDQIVGTSNLFENVGFIGGYTDGDEKDNGKVIVSLIGVVPVKTNDNTIIANDRVMSDENGYAVKSTNNCGYRVLEVLEDGLLNIVVSPNTDMIQRIKTDMEKKGSGTFNPIELPRPTDTGIIDTSTLEEKQWYICTEDVEFSAEAQAENFSDSLKNSLVSVNEGSFFCVNAFGTWCCNLTDEERDWNDCWAMNQYNIEDYLGINNIKLDNHSTSATRLMIDELDNGIYICRSRGYIGCSQSTDSSYRIRPYNPIIVVSGNNVTIIADKTYIINKSNPTEKAWEDCATTTKVDVQSMIDEAMGNKETHISDQTDITINVAQYDNKKYVCANFSTLTIDYGTATEFELWLRITITGTATVTLNHSSYIGEVPQWEAGKTYEISIVDKCAIVAEVTSV